MCERNSESADGPSLPNVRSPAEREEPRRPMGAQQLHAPLFWKRRDGDYYFTGLFKVFHPYFPTQEAFFEF